MELESCEKQKYNIKEHLCKTCGKSFPKKGNLIRHERVHTGEKPYSCDLCEKAFARKDKLIEHQRVHICEKPYHCELCEKAFVQKTGLTVHQRLHTGEKPYNCDICKKTFTNKTTLIKHKRVHTGEKPYHCDICEKAFSQKATLIGHKRLHTGEKPYNCDVCGKAFIKRSNLNSHIKVHTGETHCEICQKTFSRSSDLSRHKKSNYHIKQKEIHNASLSPKMINKSDSSAEIQKATGKLYSCEICKKSFNSSSNLAGHIKTLKHKLAHLKRKELQNTDFTSTQTTFVDCGVTIKSEDIKEEIKVEESVEDLLSIYPETVNSNDFDMLDIEEFKIEPI